MMKLTNVLKKSVILGILLAFLGAVNVFAAVTPTSDGVIIGISSTDTLITTTVQPYQKISIQNNTGGYLFGTLHGNFLGYMDPGGIYYTATVGDKAIDVILSNRNAGSGLYWVDITSNVSASAPVAPAPASTGLVDNFDAVYYAQNNPDVVAAFGTDAGLLYQHYLNYGKAEGRKPHA